MRREGRPKRSALSHGDEPKMSDVATRTTFDELALASLPEVAGFTGQLRKEAFDAFTSLPMPSQSTEEWRYTDLSRFELDHVPFTGGGGPEDVSRHGVLAAAGRGERAGLQIQLNSQVISTQRATGLVDKGVWFGDLDEAAAEHPDLVEPYLHDLVPLDRHTLHRAARRVPHRGNVPPRPARHGVELPLQTLTYLDADGAAVFPHTLLVVEAGSEVTFIDRYASPDLRRAFSNAITEIHVGDGAHVRYVSIQEWGSGVTHLGIQRATRRTRRHAPDPQHRVRRVPRSRRGRDDPRRARRLQRDARGLLRRRGPAFRPPLDPGPRRAELHQRPPLQGRAPRRRRAVYSGWVHVRPDAQKTNAMQTSRNIVLSSTRRPTRSRTSRSRRTTFAAATRRASVPSTRTRSSTSRAAASPPRGRASDRGRLLPGSARPREDRRGPRGRRARRSHGRVRTEAGAVMGAAQGLRDRPTCPAR